METNHSGNTSRETRVRPWQIVLLASVLGLGTWAAVALLVPVKLPESYPAIPDLQSQNTAFRNLLLDADSDARKHPNSAAAIGKVGMIYHSNQFYEQAESAYAIAVRMAPGDYRWPYYQALVSEESGREKEVFDLLQKTVRLQPDFAPALQKLADIYYKQERLDEAARYYERSAAAAGRDSSLQPVFGLGRVAARRKDWTKVVEYIEPLSREYPHVRPPHQLLLDAYEALGRPDKAEEERKILLESKLIVVPPIKDVLTEELLALCCSSTRLLKEAGLRSRFGHPDQAIEVARRAVAVEPEDADARHFVARTLLDTHGDRPEAVEEALAQLKEGLRLRPDDRMPLWYFAAHFFEQNKTDAAVEQLRVLLAGNAGSAEGHYYLGVVADRQGRIQEAATQYRAALKSDPNNAEAYHKLGLILVTAGKLDEAITYFEKAVQLNPMFTTARSNLGVALDERGKSRQAVVQFEEALRLKPNDGPTHMFLGIALLKQGKVEKAAAHFRETVRITPGEAQAHYGLGCALAMLQKPEEAASELREALRLRPGYAEAGDLLQKLERR